MADELRLLQVESTDARMARVLAMADAMRDAVVDQAGDEEWSPDRLSEVITAASMLAGMMFGQLIAIGAARDQDRRRVGEGVLANFRSGTDAGKRSASRVAAAMSSGGMMQ